MGECEERWRTIAFRKVDQAESPHDSFDHWLLFDLLPTVNGNNGQNTNNDSKGTYNMNGVWEILHHGMVHSVNLDMTLDTRCSDK